MDKTLIHTDQAPEPAASFHQAVRRGPFLQVSGQGPVDPATSEIVHVGDVAGQTRRALANVIAILEAAGSSLSDVIMLRVYLRNEADFAMMNEVYASILAKHCAEVPLPSRTTVITGLPRPEMLVEVDALAVVSPGSD